MKVKNNDTRGQRCLKDVLCTLKNIHMTILLGTINPSGAQPLP